MKLLSFFLTFLVFVISGFSTVMAGFIMHEKNDDNYVEYSECLSHSEKNEHECCYSPVSEVIFNLQAWFNSTLDETEVDWLPVANTNIIDNPELIVRNNSPPYIEKDFINRNLYVFLTWIIKSNK